ncbi:MAG: hypothetical protein A2Z29_02590 [Chloroflexi bacterium RBG_16_56_11]|nr:MAG: hypothetical protein A2Z29_02590 [Chloroflexi bacterium RBG_16_56_11]
MGGKTPTIVKVQTDWQTGDRSFLPFSDALEQINKVRAVVGSSVVPFLEWSSCTGPFDTNTTQQYNGITTKDVISGSLDDYIRQFARDIKKWGEPLFIRPIGGEFNYVFWKWCAPLANPQLTVADFVGAWRHTVDIFRQEGVTNVAWVWTPYPPPPNPDISWKGDRNFESYYPGDDYVDWAGGDNYARAVWLDSLYNFALAHQKPFFLAEWGARAPGSTMTHDQQNAWFEEMFDYFESHVKIKAILYFNYHWGDVSQETAAHIAAEHILLYDGQVNYHPDVNIGDSRLIAGGKNQRELFAKRINNQRYISNLMK